MKPLLPRPNAAISICISSNSLFQIAHFSKAPFHPSNTVVFASRRHEPESRNIKVSVWWDFENCHLPTGSNMFRVAQSISSAIRANGIKGPIQITAFGDLMQMSRVNQEAISSTGIRFTHVPNGGKNSADRSLIVDLMNWVSQNPPPAHIFLISGDRDFASILHRLRMNNYNILLATLQNVPNVLSSAASIMWQWSALIRGEDLIGKCFNQPPDGPCGSWYGHYKAPLEDPFMAIEQPTKEPSDSNSNSKPQSTPKDSTIRKAKATKVSLAESQKQRSSPSPCSPLEMKSSSLMLQEPTEVQTPLHKMRLSHIDICLPSDEMPEAHSILHITGSQETGSYSIWKPWVLRKLWKKWLWNRDIGKSRKEILVDCK